MVPKPFVGYYEFVYEFVHRQCEPSLLYHLIVDVGVAGSWERRGS